MNIAFHTAASGMQAFQKGLDLTSHNLANINTNGYKPVANRFASLMSQAMDVNQETPYLKGHGAKLAAEVRHFQQGMLTDTGSALDFAIAGAGFFGIDQPEGGIAFTRNGNFSLGLQGDQVFLTTTEGARILNKDRQPIEVPRNADTKELDLAQLNEDIGIFLVDHPEGLILGDQGYWQESKNSGQIRGTNLKDREEAYDLRNGMVEGSAVDMASEMISMMVLQRAYQLNAKLVQAADQIEEMSNSLR